MLTIVAILFVAMKALVLLEFQARTSRRLPAARLLGFVAAWPGMDPAAFLRRLPPAPGEIAGHLRRAAIALTAGALTLAAARVLRGSGLHADALALMGLSLTLHFGVFTLFVAFWRWRGAAVGPLFDDPFRARGLGEFWGRRWNVAFTQMAAALVYRPVATRAGRRAALLAAFGFSGLLHELAVSVPAGAGFGGPTAYFLLQGALVAASLPPRRLVTATALLLPLPLLFHTAFRARVVWAIVSW
jgi:alginate O-acetyltransferase complex protein AlgI